MAVRCATDPDYFDSLVRSCFRIGASGGWRARAASPLFNSSRWVHNANQLWHVLGEVPAVGLTNWHVVMQGTGTGVTWQPTIRVHGLAEQPRTHRSHITHALKEFSRLSHHYAHVVLDEVISAKWLKKSGRLGKFYIEAQVTIKSSCGIDAPSRKTSSKYPVLAGDYTRCPDWAQSPHGLRMVMYAVVVCEQKDKIAVLYKDLPHAQTFQKKR